MRYGRNHPDYGPNHKRVRKLFGQAKEYQCWLCFDDAVGWAWLWRTHTDPADPRGYIPLCRMDHDDYDAESRKFTRRPMSKYHYRKPGAPKTFKTRHRKL